MLRYEFIFDGGYSKRFHTVDTLKYQDIASHSFGVAWVCEIITDGKARKELIMAALSHDLAEHRTGDIPSPAKRAMGIGQFFHDHEMDILRNEGLAEYHDELTEGEQCILKLADMVEGMIYCLRERTLGNRNVELPFIRFHGYAMEVLCTPAQEAETSWAYDRTATEQLINDIHNHWKEVINVRS